MVTQISEEYPSIYDMCRSVCENIVYNEADRLCSYSSGLFTVIGASEYEFKRSKNLSTLLHIVTLNESILTSPTKMLLFPLLLPDVMTILRHLENRELIKRVVYIKLQENCRK